MITFLIAGHETTSGALSFALHYLLKHPTALARARAEVDELWGGDAEPDPRYEDVGRLTYIRQVLNESLRLWPTAPSYAVEPREDTVIGGRYAVRAGQTLMVLTPALHRDPAWGDNVESFDPDRFAAHRDESRPAHLFKPLAPASVPASDANSRSTKRHWCSDCWCTATGSTTTRTTS